MMKMVIMSFLPISVYLFHEIKKCMLSRSASKAKDGRTRIDRAYSMMVTNLEIMVSFCLFCPLLYPIILVAINSWILFYKFAIDSLGWKVKFTWHGDMNSFPFHFLIFGLIIHQLLATLFLLFGVQNLGLSYGLLAVYALSDLYLLFQVTYGHKKGNAVSHSYNEFE